MGREHDNDMDHQDRREATFGILPLELLEQILNEAWLSGMSPKERANFSESISLASPLWAATLARIRATYIYFPPSETEHPQNVPQWFIKPEGSGVPALYLCRTLTRQIPCSKQYLSSRRESMSRKALREMLSTFRELPIIQGLRTFSVEFFDKELDHPHDSSIPFALRASIIELDVEYTLSSATPTWVVEALGLTEKNEWQQTNYTPWALPELYHISTPCDSPASLGGVLQLCSHLELTQDDFGLEMRILNSSDEFQSHWTVVHGPLFMPNFLDNHPIRLGYATIRGRALGLVFDFKKKTKSGLRAMNTPRQLGILRRRVGPY